MAEPSLVEGTIVGRYEIRSLIGAGGMGEVYLGRDRTLDRPVALKILPQNLVGDSHRVQRFLTEARAASALNHPAIVTIHDSGEEQLPSGERIHYIAMELVEGVTLAELTRNPQPLRNLLRQLSEVAEGLGKAHAKGIIHRDLKPENIMITSDGHAKILDFGVAKLIETERDCSPSSSGCRTLTAASARLGTPGYMSPEQIEGHAIDHRSDIFSFGAVLYEAITAVPPFSGQTSAETQHNTVHRHPAPLKLADRHTSDALQEVLERCLDKDREKRYDSARDLSADLLHAAAMGKPLARTGAGYRFGRSLLFRAAVIISALIVAAFLLRLPAGALVESMAASVIPSKNPEVRRLEQMLSVEREQNHQASAALTSREQEIARRDIEIERLRASRDEGERLRTDLETSYRRLLTDVNQDLRRNSSERSQLRDRITVAENELQRFRADSDLRSAQQARLTAIQKALAPIIDARLEARGLVLTLPGLFFRYGNSAMVAESEGVLQRIAEQLLAHPEVKVAIEGHTDTTGSTDGNLALSQERADFVRDYLVTTGVEVNRMTTVGRGESFPVFSNASSQGRAANRRVELILSH